ncbi:MAG: hypothetical protein WC459_00295 [Patescibacteria group bacterium]
MIARIIVGIIGTALGIAMNLKTEAFLRFTGKIPWAEQHLGVEGGTRLFYKLLGLIIIFLSWIYAFNWLNGLLQFLLGGLFRG